MSGKFMKVKRVVIPTLTIAIIASQLMGCASVTQSELLQMLKEGQAIEIEIATPISEEQGTQKPIDWIQLDQLTTYADFRNKMDDLMKTTPYGNGSKNGIAYINLEGKQEGNNTLHNALMNRKFVDNFYQNEAVNLELQQIINSIYADADEGNAMMAAINAYWNLLPDAEPNYFNGDSTLSRLEAMSLLARANTPVQENIGNQTFTEAVGKTEFTDLASLVAKDSYLTTSDKSLNATTAKGTITRGEYIYILISNVFGSDRLDSADIKKASFSDCKNAGDIASQQKLKEEDKSKDYYDSAELKFTLNNPDGGCPTKMYQSLAAAQELEIISSETRWDEGLTKEEAIQLYLDAMQAYTRINGYPVDLTSGAEAAAATTTQTQTQTPTTPEKEETTIEVGDTVISYTITDMDKEMLISESTPVYSTPLSYKNKAGEAKKDEAVRVTGYVDGTNWYRIKLSSGLEAYTEDTYLKEKPQQQQTQTQTQQSQQQTQEQQQPQTQEQPQQQPPVVQQPQEQIQPPSNSNVYINPYTGQPMKPGESFQDPDGVRRHAPETDAEASKRWAEKYGGTPIY